MITNKKTAITMSTKFHIVLPRAILKKGWNNTANTANRNPNPSFFALKYSYERYAKAAITEKRTNV